MEILRLIGDKSKNCADVRTPTIAFFGDSVTQGCFNFSGGAYKDYCDRESGYPNLVAKMLEVLYPKTPINIIHAGIAGENTRRGLMRLERDVIAYHPDLTVVAFGLNDACSIEDCTLQYGERLREIFTRLQNAGSEVIYMTPNMMATSVYPGFTNKAIVELDEKVVKCQSEGTDERYYNVAKKVAAKCGAHICDVYSKWKKLASYGVNIDGLLANHINHPTKEMHYLFAYSLIETMAE